METKNKTVAKNEIKQPKNKYTIFPITVTEWENNNISSYTISKAYKTDKTESGWDNTDSFSEADLCIIAKILSKI
jgi:hypothetical protein